MENAKVKVLYVDDEPINLKLFELNFNKKYDIITAESGSDGLDILNKHQDINIVISDMRMPQMNGITFCKTAKESYSHISYYLLTGFDSTPEIEQALKEHIIIQCLRKPFNKTEIDSIISQVA